MMATNWHLIAVPQEYVECERYGNAVIATRLGLYKGFGVHYETSSRETRAEVRRLIDDAMAEKL
ncbi:hypothetical protein [Sphingobium sp. MK2]|uniref:hypothetical protein n=1 Tax=Sphingobium sp. MK2 TaxID=3116540 RepID=UPI0032E3678C